MKSTFARWIRLALGILGLSTLVADGGLSQVQLDCEEAVSYLQGCCPGFKQDETVACQTEQGCDTSTEPALSISESQCIVALSCSEVVSRGICERVQNLPSPTTGEGGEGGSASTSSSLVCP
jgi:hypothetical protein